MALPLLFPQVLMFPQHVEVDGWSIYSEVPLPRPALDAVLADATRRVKSSPIADPAGETRTVVLTTGGWRWNMLALQSRKSFALTRAATNYMVINRSDVSANRMANGPPGGAARTLSSIIAHETCHGMVRRHFGLLADLTKPAWLREGYCDYVAQESTLDEARAAEIKARGEDHPAMVYFEGRKRVAATLAANGGDVEKLFAEAQ
ncbi:MAG: hypothetical protein ACKOPO_05645 [Novosphingobium sp.]